MSANQENFQRRFDRDLDLLEQQFAQQETDYSQKEQKEVMYYGSYNKSSLTEDTEEEQWPLGTY